MKFRRYLSALAITCLLLLPGGASSYWQSREQNGAGASGSCSSSSSFLARTSGLDATHTSAYDALICGLVTDGIFSKLDFLQVYATQDSTTANLNLVSTNFTAVPHGSPTFTVDRGYTGVDGSTTVYVDSTFNPATASSPNFVQNSAHLSLWSVLDTTSSNAAIGASNGVGQGNLIYPRYVDGNAYYRANSQGEPGVSSATGKGHYIANRSSSTAIQGYKNGSNVLTNNGAGSFTIVNASFITVGDNIGSAPPIPTGWAGQLAEASCGSSLSSTDATNFYNRLRTYMTAVGVP